MSGARFSKHGGFPGHVALPSRCVRNHALKHGDARFIPELKPARDSLLHGCWPCMHPKISIGNTAAGARPPGGQPWCLPSTRSSVGNGGNGKKKGHQAAVPIRTAETEHPTHLPHGPFPSGSTGIPCVTPSILALRAVTPRGRSLLRAGRPGPAASSPSRVRRRLSQLGYFHRALYCPT